MAKKKSSAKDSDPEARSASGTDNDTTPSRKTVSSVIRNKPMGSSTARKILSSIRNEKRTGRILLGEVKNSFNKAKEEIAKTIITTEAPDTDLDITGFYGLSRSTLSDYVTLDWHHCADILGLMDRISDYAQDQSRKRPLNIMMQAESGSGKSHFIKCLTKTMSAYNIQEVSFNMTALERIDDLTKPLDAVRNVKVNDKLPLLFLDEFDCAQKNFPILLPLLWDGELQVGHRDLKVGKVVIIIASSGKNIAEVMKSTKEMRKESKEGTGKVVDLLSRINGGVLTIPGLDDVTGDRDRRVDKVCLAIALLTQRFGNELERVPWSLLSFISQSKFRYGVRSIAHLVDLIPASHLKRGKLKTTDLNLPLADVRTLKEGSLAYHLIAEDGPAAIIDLWRQLKKQSVSVRFKRAVSEFEWEALQRFLLKTSRRRDSCKRT